MSPLERCSSKNSSTNSSNHLSISKKSNQLAASSKTASLSKSKKNVHADLVELNSSATSNKISTKNSNTNSTNIDQIINKSSIKQSIKDNYKIDITNNTTTHDSEVNSSASSSSSNVNSIIEVSGGSQYRAVKAGQLTQNEEIIVKKIETTDTQSTSDVILDVRIYKERYINLLVLSLALFLNAELWISLPSINSTLTSLWSVEPESIDWMSNVFLVVYAIQIVPFTFLPQIIGLKWCIVGGAICNLSGALFRLLAFLLSLTSVSSSNVSFGICLFGNILAAGAQGFLLFLPPLLSFEWFSDKERNLSTTIAVMSNIFGTAIGFLFVFVLLTNLDSVWSVNQILTFSSGIEASIGLITLIIAIFFCRDKPPTPPSLANAEQLNSDNQIFDIKTSDGRKKVFFNFWIQIKKLFKNGRLMPIIFAYGSYYGISTAFYTFLDDMISMYLIEMSNIVGYLGSVGIILGTLTTVGLSYLMQKVDLNYHQYVSGVVCMLAAIFTTIILLIIHFKALSVALSFVFVILYAVSAAPYLSFGLEMMSRVAHPIPANVSSSLGLISANIFGIIMLYGYGLISRSTRYYVFLGVSASLYLIDSLMLLIINYRTKTQNKPN